MTALPRTRGFIERADARIYYETMGQGPALVFAHGLGGNHLSWWQQVPAFSDRYTCITFSHRGFHPSTAPAGGPDPDDFAGDLLALIDHLGISDIAIVAQSMGGWTAVDFAFRHPDRLRAMVLASTSGPIAPALAGPGVESHLADWQAQAQAAVLAARASGVHPAMGMRGAAEQPAMHALYRGIDELSAGIDKDALRAGLGRTRTRPGSDLAAIATPTLWLTGSEDIVFPSVTAPIMAAHMPRARHVSVHSAGHSVYFERAHAFNRLVAEFLETV